MVENFGGTSTGSVMGHPSSASYYAGRLLGDFFSIDAGSGIGTVGEGITVVGAATSEAVVGVPVAIVGVGVMAYGAKVMGSGVVNGINDARMLAESINGGNGKSSGQVSYGNTDLSKKAIAFRQKNNIYSARNVAVFEYKENGVTKTIVVVSERGVGHAERLAGKKLNDMGIQPNQVTRIYSELEPCNVPGGYCKNYINKTYTNAEVTYSFEYGATKESRTRGVGDLRNEVKSLNK